MKKLTSTKVEVLEFVKSIEGLFYFSIDNVVLSIEHNRGNAPFVALSLGPLQQSARRLVASY